MQEFLDQHEAVCKPLCQEAALAAWRASITGAEADYEDSRQKQLQLEKLYTNREDFTRIQAWRQDDSGRDPMLKRQIELLYLEYLNNQIPEGLLERLIETQNEVDQIFSRFRGRIADQSYSDNDLREVLKTSNDSGELQAAWEASKQVGSAVQPKLLDVVRLRNEAARTLGFSNFFALEMVLQEFDEKEFWRLFDELDHMTRDAFARMKVDVDAELARRYGVSVQELRPWHYQNPFFQEAPQVFDVDTNAIYSGVDILAIVERYYDGIGMQISDILERSDLYERKGKNPHAYCTHIDRVGDVRVFANIRQDEYWMGTMLHEVGHAVYEKYLDPALPFLLRGPSHTLSTEAIAMLFGRMSKNAVWMQQMLGVAESERRKIADEVRRMLTFEQLTFSRWVQVMVRFERALYENPDQDLNGLWWDLVEKYQMLRRPENRNAPDYAAKYHVAMAPAYYHNYLLGEMMASQVHDHIASKILHEEDPWSVTYVNRPEVGAYLAERIFAPGALYSWNDLVQHATGAPLEPRAFAAQFVAQAQSI